VYGVPDFNRKEYCLLVQNAYKTNNWLSNEITNIMGWDHVNIRHTYGHQHDKMFGHLYYAARQYNQRYNNTPRPHGSVNRFDIETVAIGLITKQTHHD
jgi:hypothetical protein